MILYHFNFGFPLMDEQTRIILPSRKVVPREEKTPVQHLDKWQKPTAGYTERVYYHEQFREKAGRVTAIVRNPRFPCADGKVCVLDARLTWSAAQLPALVQWKMPGEGTYVLGLEPANCRVGGRAAERERGSPVHLQPGESRTYELEIAVQASTATTKES